MANQGMHHAANMGIQGGGGGGGHKQMMALSPHVPISYQGYSLCKGLAAPGQQGTWSRPQVDSFSVTSTKASEYIRKMKGISAMSVYGALNRDSHKAAVNKVLNDQRAAEKNKVYATWDFAAILPKRESIPGTLGYASEVKSITVILKRHPKPDPSVEMPASTMYNGPLDPTRPYMPMPQSHPAAHMNAMPRQVNNVNGIDPHNLPPPPNLPGAGPLPRPPNMPGGQGHHFDGPQRMPGPVPNHGGPINMNPDRQGHMGGGHMNGHPNRRSMDNFEKMQDWDRRGGGGGFVESVSLGSDDSDSDGRPYDDRRDSKQRRQHMPRRPSMEAHHGPRARKGTRPESPIPKKKTSTQDVRRANGTQERIKNVVEYRRPRSNSGSSESSYDKMSEFSRKSDSTRGTEYSRDSFEGPRYRRSRSRDHLRKEHDRRHERSRSRSRDRRRRDSHRVSKDSSRRHKLPEPYRGLSPARDSDSERERPIHVHIHNPAPDMTRTPSNGSSNASLWNGSYPQGRRAIQYPDNDPYDMSGLLTNLPPAPMAPNRVTTARRIAKEQRLERDAEAYMRAQETEARAKEIFNRGVKVGRRKTLTENMFDDPVERQQRRYADREWEDIDWDGPSHQRWKMTDDLVEPDYVSGGYGTTSKRNSHVDGQYDNVRYGETGYSMRGGRRTNLF